MSAEAHRNPDGRVDAGRVVGRDVELITSDDVRLHARQWDATGTPRATVVVVHGFASSLDEVKLVALVDALRAAGFDGIAYDARAMAGRMARRRSGIGSGSTSRPRSARSA